MRQSLIAPLSITTGMLIFAFADNFVILIAERMGVWQYLATRSALVVPLMAAAYLVLGHGRLLRTTRSAAVAARVTFSVLALLLYFAAIPVVGVSMAAAGLFTSPVFVMVFSVVFFGERLGPRRILAAILGFAGVCLVLGIGKAPVSVLAIAPALGGASYALNVIWTRRYCRNETTSALAFWNLVGFLVLGAIGMAFMPVIGAALGGLEGSGFATMGWQTPHLSDLLLIFCMGVGAVGGVVFLVIGYQSAASTYAALFDFSFLFWATLFSWMLWGAQVETLQAAGMAMIVAAGVLALIGSQSQDAAETGT